MNWEKFQNAYSNAPQEIKDIIDSEKISDCIEAQIAINTIDSGQRKDVLLVTSHYLLKTVSDIEAMGHLTKLGIPNANVIMEHLLECVTAGDAAPEPTTQIHSLAEDVAPQEKPRWESEEPTYSSTQSALMQEAEKKAVQYIPPKHTQ